MKPVGNFDSWFQGAGGTVKLLDSPVTKNTLYNTHMQDQHLVGLKSDLKSDTID
jgi:hypothetical protein